MMRRKLALLVVALRPGFDLARHRPPAQCLVDIGHADPGPLRHRFGGYAAVDSSRTRLRRSAEWLRPDFRAITTARFSSKP